MARRDARRLIGAGGKGRFGRAEEDGGSVGEGAALVRGRG